MNTLALALVLLSTFMHAGWNLLARGERREGEFFLRMLVVSCGVGLLPAVLSEWCTRSIPPMAWVCVAGSGVCCGVYYFFLARAYQSSDFTVVYPIARALPVLVVGAADMFRGRAPSPVGWAGMVFVVLGCALAPLHAFRDVSWRRYWNRTSLWMLLTALGTVGYTLLDKVASEAVLPGPGTAARYGYFFFLFSLLAYAAGRRIFRDTSENMVSGTRENPIGGMRTALAALLNFGAYWLVLWAYQSTQRAGYIVAFRQFSIVIGVAIAFAVFKERGLAVRLTGTLLITLGLVLVALWGG